MKTRLINYIIKLISPSTLTKINNQSETIDSLMSTLDQCKEDKKHMEYLIDQPLILSKRFDKAVLQIQQLTPKARATFYYKLIEVIDDAEELDTITRYVYLRNKQNGI